MRAQSVRQGGRGRRLAVTLLVGAALLAPCLMAPASEARRIGLDMAQALAEHRPLVVKEIGRLTAGGRQTFRFDMPRIDSLDLRVPLDEAPFNGTQLNVEINGRRLLPYFAFGGDTRYDSVRGKPGMRPPVAAIEGR